MRMALNLSRLPFSRLFRQLEQDMETVVKVLQPGPLGIIEHKFTDEEIKSANSTVNRAVENWRRAAYSERNNPIMKDFIDAKTFTFQHRR
ncbi:zinc metalloproteinase aureolysin [Perilla frutescens var. hirtella]|uniref:Zinc metalloproteinase aureolysin n=1 Tax=Perilla frutescens var. hirtella TaxID=608512 RepID=A0AAD4IVB7_PERFH|nr:zinc metalloproteinase aureolysin [Perilla frutescens var. hirtella]KAH6811128.1 zinc metalloproteinase aureolysin [Perilla frutescens var. frutescens]KAH6821766.1 zinc metalloproteinase aureolysin [Perilla frutescens var. hirtella]